MELYNLVVSAVYVSDRRTPTHYQSIARYLGLVINTIDHWLYKSTPIPKNPTYSYKDVTIMLNGRSASALLIFICSSVSLPARVAPTRVFSVLPHVRDKHWLLVDEQVDEAMEHGHCIIDARIGGLAEEVR
jgi:hypothetical protein